MSDIFDHLNDAYDSLDEMYEDMCAEGVVCKYCQTSFLKWGETEKGWRLFDSQGNIHLCRSKPQLILKKRT